MLASARACDRQHAALQAEDLSAAYISPGADLFRLWARILTRYEWRHLHWALLQTVALLDTYSRRRKDGTALLDLAQPSQVFLIYANADPKGGSCGGLVPISEIARRSLAHAGLSKLQREKRVLELGLAIRPSNGKTTAIEKDATQTLTIELASLLLSEEEIENLRDIGDRVPAISILALTTFKGGASIEWQHLTVLLPGKWLGTSAVAGNA